MPRIAYQTKDFLHDYRSAERAVQRRIDAFLEKFETETRTGGLRLKQLTKRVDKRMRTARIDADWRAVLAVVQGDDLALLRAMKHDDAIAFAQSHRLDVSAVTGQPRIIAMIDAPATPTKPTEPEGGSPLAHRTVEDIFATGVPRDAIPALKALTSDADVHALGSFLGTSDPLIEFAIELLLDRHLSIDEILAELLTLVGEPGPEPSDDQAFPRPTHDADDLAGALSRPGAAERFRVVDDSAELIAALHGDLDDWQVFLHPLQQRAAYGMAASGPARVSGGAGTGKTVVLLHRAKALLERPHHDGYSPRILVTTYTEHLRSDLRDLLARLVGDECAEHVQIETVDSLARALFDQMDGTPVIEVSAGEETEIWEEILTELPAIERSSVFVRNEYRHVILANGIRSSDEYATTSRVGRGTRLARSERLQLWPAFEAFDARTRGAGRQSTLQLTEDVAALLERSPADLYDHVLVDEAQDLHPAQWRLLRALVPPGPDDLFIVGDAFQRIYGNNASLRSLGIETRGRSVRLRRNYRSTREIAGWALGVIGHRAVMDLDDHGADLDGYHSVRSGPEPVLHAHSDRGAELARVVDIVRKRLADEYPPDHIAIAARTPDEVREIVGATASAGIVVAEIGGAGRAADAVNVATMHRLKGLEFPCVIVTGLGADNLPPRHTICPPDVDPAQHRADADAERALVYVAATRARDHLDLTWTGAASSLLPVPPTEHETAA